MKDNERRRVHTDADESEGSPGPAQFTWPQFVALIVGALYFVGGIVGFFFLGDPATDLAGRSSGSSGNTMLGLELSGLQNVVHLVLGITGLICAAATRRARGYGIVLAVVGLVLFGYGVVAVTDLELDVLGLNWPDNILHGVTALVGLATALVRVPESRTEPRGRAAA